MAILPRCNIGSAGIGSWSGAGASPAIASGTWTNAGAGPSGTAPAAGDMVLVAGTVLAASQTVTTSSTGWLIQSSDNNANATSAFTTFAAWHVWTASETDPGFSWATSATSVFSAIALVPDSGFQIGIDTWAAVKVDTTAATTHTANAATAAAGLTDASVILTGTGSNTTGGTSTSFTAPANWTGGLANSHGATGVADISTFAAYRTGQTGTVTPGAETAQGGGGNSTNGTYANLYHALVSETAPVPVRLFLRQAVKRAAFY